MNQIATSEIAQQLDEEISDSKHWMKQIFSDFRQILGSLTSLFSQIQPEKDCTTADKCKHETRFQGLEF